MSLKSKSGKSKIYLSITPGVGLELIQLDIDSKTVANYAMRELAYNESTRELVDYDAFKSAVEEMYEELNINPKVEVVVNMPLVSFGTMQLGLLLSNDTITSAIQNELEQTYIFRRSEPALDWIEVLGPGSNAPGKETRQILYSAIQKAVIDKISAKLTEIGSTLVGIENSLSSTFRALEFLGATTTQLEPNTTWNLLIVSAVGYSIVSMSGKNVIEYYEEPLPTKSYEEDQIYDAIAQSAQIALSSYPANYLYVVSDTDLVSAEALVSRLNIMGTINFLENNSFKTQEALMPVSLNVLPNYTSKISLQAIGCALTDTSDFPLKFRYLAEKVQKSDNPSCTIPIGEHEITITKQQAMIGAIGFLILACGLTMLISNVLLPGAKKSKQAAVEKIGQDLSAATEQLDALKGKGPVVGFDIKNEVKTGVQNNRAKLMNYVAAGDSIPQDVWLTYFITKDNGLVDIQGVASDVSSVYVFFKNMRDSLIGTKLKLQKLEMETKSVDAAVIGAGTNYVFEITNMSEADMSAPAGENGENGENPVQSPEQTSNSNSAPSQELLGTQPINN